MADNVHASTEAHGGGGGHSGSFPPFDPSTFASQLLWLALTFGAFYLVLSRVLLPRLAGILETRADRIARDLAEAQRLKAESDAAGAAYEAELAAARRKAQEIAGETRAALNAAVEQRRHTAEAGLSAKIAEAETRIGEIKDRAMAEVGGIAVDTTEAVLSVLSKVSATRQEVTAAVEASMAK
jgi:F-type H+-transporting ATPase subunit b